jgi:hypothetical protein
VISQLTIAGRSGRSGKIRELWLTRLARSRDLMMILADFRSA